MNLEKVVTDKAPRPVGPYAQALTADDLVFCSGQVALDPATGELVRGDIRDQTRRSLANLEAVLRASGSDLQHVLKTTVFLSDMNDFKDMNAIYAEAFGAHTPARSTVEVGKLPLGARVEIECIAIRAS